MCSPTASMNMENECRSMIESENGDHYLKKLPVHKDFDIILSNFRCNT